MSHTLVIINHTNFFDTGNNVSSSVDNQAIVPHNTVSTSIISQPSCLNCPMDIDHISSDHMSNAVPDVITGDVFVAVRTRFQLKRVSTSQNPFNELWQLFTETCVCRSI